MGRVSPACRVAAGLDARTGPAVASCRTPDTTNGKCPIDTQALPGSAAAPRQPRCTCGSLASGYPGGPRGADGEVAALQDAAWPVAVEEGVERGQVAGAYPAVEVGPEPSQRGLGVTASRGGGGSRQIDREGPAGLDGEASLGQVRAPVGAEMRQLVGVSFGHGGMAARFEPRAGAAGVVG